MFEYWLDPITKKPLTKSEYNRIIKKETRWEIKEVIKVSSRHILETAKRYFGCDEIDGMYLENQGEGGSKGNHWESDLIMNEIMTSMIVFG